MAQSKLEIPVIHPLSHLKMNNNGGTQEEFRLEGSSTRRLFANFPTHAHFILIRLIPHWSWLLAIPGIVRRLFRGQVIIRGITTVEEGGTGRRWLVIENIMMKPLSTHLSLSSEVGIQGFLDYLRTQDMRYVVLRSYESLPDLPEKNDDLDILIADEDQQKVKEFLAERPGGLIIGVHGVSLGHRGVPYYPPRLARAILEHAIDGPAGSRIPDPESALLSLAYHVVYHKGFTGEIPEKYSRPLQKMAERIGISIPMTMEGLDAYIGRAGWRPRRDTLAKIASANEWVRRHYLFSPGTPEIGLGVFILKKRAFQMCVVDSLLRAIAERGEFLVLRTKIFTESERPYIADHLRGGVWAEYLDTAGSYVPSMAVVILDKRLAHASKLGISKSLDPSIRINNLKRSIRERFDEGTTSLVHSTDSTDEAWEYVEVCFPEDVKSITREVGEVYDNLTPSWFERIQVRATILSGKLRRIKKTIRERIIRWVSS